MGSFRRRGTYPLQGQPPPSFLNVGVAYLLWCAGLMGICGLQRFYVGQPVVGIVYLITFGLCGFAQFIDLFLIPGMVDQRNTYLKGRYLALAEQAEAPSSTPTPLHRLLQVAKEQGGVLSAAQAALYTGFDAKQVEELLFEAQRLGYAHVFNDPETGAVRYQFDV
ncbi:TM2 domain-containing protein [uncultured Thermosynechococcus sp.]|uniref:TM2 domain-containing protein n=1 Tax=uncultured Thermosynechococcus sp. TaxID=436945 RepID=UPI00260F5D35|nr:TM2 domain-containing protein [uncultured Thermosynechococcus sp.]